MEDPVARLYAEIIRGAAALEASGVPGALAIQELTMYLHHGDRTHLEHAATIIGITWGPAGDMSTTTTR